MAPIIASLPLAGFVFWLMSFPMNGYLMPGEWENNLVYFTLSSAMSYFLSPFILKDSRTFDGITKLASLCVILLTIMSHLSIFPGRVILVLMGVLSIFVMFRAIATIRRSANPALSGGLAIATGNTLVFLLANINIDEVLKFFIISASLFPAIVIKADLYKDSDFRKTRNYLAFIFVFYLVGGILYAYIMPEYEKVAPFRGFELLSYVLAAFAGIYLVRGKRDIVLAAGIILGALSFTLMLFGGTFFTVSGMVASQASFGLIDLFIVLLLVYSGGTPWITGAGFGTVCLAITIGEVIGTQTGNSSLTEIALGNLVLMASLVLFHYRNTRGRKDTDTEERQNAEPSTSVPEPDTSRSGLSMEKLELLLESYYEPYQKKLSEKEKSVLLRILQGKTYREAARDLGVSDSTVKTHMKRIFEKTGTHNKEALIRRLSINGIPEGEADIQDDRHGDGSKTEGELPG